MEKQNFFSCHHWLQDDQLQIVSHSSENSGAIPPSFCLKIVYSPDEARGLSVTAGKEANTILDTADWVAVTT